MMIMTRSHDRSSSSCTTQRPPGPSPKQQHPSEGKERLTQLLRAKQSKAKQETNRPTDRPTEDIREQNPDPPSSHVVTPRCRDSSFGYRSWW